MISFTLRLIEADIFYRAMTFCKAHCKGKFTTFGLPLTKEKTYPPLMQFNFENMQDAVMFKNEFIAHLEPR